MAGTLNFTRMQPTQQQIQDMAGAGVTISTVTFPEVADIQITSDDETEGWDSRLAEGMSVYGWFCTGVV